MSDNMPLILCIDDDDDILSFLQVVLEAEGYRYVGASSAEDGLRAYKQNKPDLIILDLIMEEVDAGTTFVKELQRLQNDVPIIMLSSVGDNLNATASYTDIGLAGIFQKPLSKGSLLALLKARLGAKA